MNPEELQAFLSLMARAVKFAENNPKNHGVLSIKTDNPDQVVTNSVKKNYDRWSTGQKPAKWIDEKPKKYVDFMQRRWAPIGAENDPDGLNVNWAPNVRWFIKQNVAPEMYQKYQDLNLVRNAPWMRGSNLT